MADPFRLVADGLEVSLAPEEVVFFGDLLRLLGGLGGPDEDPGAARLDPPVYLGDPEADAEWKRFAGAELWAARSADRSSLQTVLDALSDAHARGQSAVVVSLEEANAMLRVVNDARLVLGARWGIDSPEDYDRLRPESSEILDYLGWFVSHLAITLSGAIDS